MSDRDWILDWGPDLWSLLSDPAERFEDFSEDFWEVAQNVRRKMKKVDVEGFPHAHISTFLKDWFHKQKIPRQDWEERVVVMALFGLDWSLEDLSKVLGVNASRIRMRAFQTLCESNSLDIPHKSKECARNDLHVVDVLLKRPWVDPMGLYTRDDFDLHLQGCSRCSVMMDRFVTSQKQYEAMRVRHLPAEWTQEIQSEGSDEGKWLLTRWFASQEWYVRIPLQLGSAAVAVMAVLAVPYYKDVLNKKSTAASSESEESKLGATDEDIFENMPPDDPVVAGVSTTSTLVTAMAPTTSTSTSTLAVVAKIAPPTTSTTRLVAFLPTTLPYLAPPWTKVTTTTLAVVRATTSTSTTFSTAAMLTAAADAARPTDASNIFFRWGARAQDPDRLATNVKNMLVRFRAQQAGELEMGAVYKGGRYFHFTVQTGEYEKLVSEVRGMPFSDFTSTQAISDRKADPGMLRIVLWIGPAQ